MTPRLGPGDPHHWGPSQSMIDSLCQRLSAEANVLEIGPGPIPFPRAKTFVDIKDFGIGLKTVNVDCNDTPLPFKDKEFDFVYCRHVLEDMFNPFLLCSEMGRVAKAGYVETPSPLCEFIRGVDGGAAAWRGYHHHRYLVWPHNGILTFLGKFPLIEYIGMEDEPKWIEALKGSPNAWNSWMEWTGELRYRHLQCPQDYHLPNDYPKMIVRAIGEWSDQPNRRA